MEIRKINDSYGVAPQISRDDVSMIAAAGYRAIICNRPDGEGNDQPLFREIADAAEAAGLPVHYLPVTTGKISDDDVEAFDRLFADLPKPVLAFCRTGTRSETLWSHSGTAAALRARELDAAKAQDLNTSPVARHVANQNRAGGASAHRHFDIVIVGGGSAGVSVAASLLQRAGDLDIAIIDPADVHYYQPGWTLVGGGAFAATETARPMAKVIPRKVKHIRAGVAAFEPEKNAVLLEDESRLAYGRLIVCPGLKLDWNAIDGLAETLGKNGVTSNYRYDLAPYTWRLVQELKSGVAVFTQPPMPIKCAGAPQKAMYLSADHWHRKKCLDAIDVSFCNAGQVLFGVKEYIPALMEYVGKYNLDLALGQNLVSIDGPAHKAVFAVTDENGNVTHVERHFDMIHVCPPQSAPDFIKVSPLADDAGWVDVDPDTLRHKSFDNIWSLGDVMNAPNAKTAAAVRKQAPVVARNILVDMGRLRGVAHYDGYGSCPLTVERGKIVLAEFGYGGKLLPSFPGWLIDGTRPSRLAWLLKEKILPPVYWHLMLKGREWLARPHVPGVN